MTDDELRAYLDSNGYPDHVIEGGREGLISRYREFVAEAARGYEYSLQDYRRDLDGRALIHMIEADDEVRDEDELLNAVLVNREVRVWESAPDNPFWDFGYPETVRGPLMRQIKAAGLLDAD